MIFFKCLRTEKMILLQIIIGLGVSLALLGFLLPIIRVPFNDKDPLDSMELLQAVWLVSRRKDLQDSIELVAKPTTSQLRREGVFQICPVRLDEKHGSEN
jgi:hypothetical protein